MIEDSKKSWLPSRRRWLVAFGLCWVFAGPFLLFFYKDSHAGWASMFTGLIVIAVSRLDDIQEIALASFTMKLFERRVDKVEDTVRDVRKLAKQSSKFALSSLQYSGRYGGTPEDIKYKNLADTRALLEHLGLPSDEIEDVEAEWHAVEEFDYTRWALREAPKHMDEEHARRWQQMRDGGVAGRASPETIRAFFKELNALTPELEETLKDYEHYIATREHRRQEVWRKRYDR